MAGLDKIKSQILDEAKVTADAKIEDAKAQAEQMKLKAQEEGARQADTILHFVHSVIGTGDLCRGSTV